MNPIEQIWAEIRKIGFNNKTFKVINRLQEVIQGLRWYALKAIVYRKWGFF